MEHQEQSYSNYIYQQLLIIKSKPTFLHVIFVGVRYGPPLPRLSLQLLVLSAIDATCTMSLTHTKLQHVGLHKILKIWFLFSSLALEQGEYRYWTRAKKMKNTKDEKCIRNTWNLMLISRATINNLNLYLEGYPGLVKVHRTAAWMLFTFSFFLIPPPRQGWASYSVKYILMPCPANIFDRLMKFWRLDLK